jgi:hypothetical protein
MNNRTVLLSGFWRPSSGMALRQPCTLRLAGCQCMWLGTWICLPRTQKAQYPCWLVTPKRYKLSEACPDIAKDVPWLRTESRGLQERAVAGGPACAPVRGLASVRGVPCATTSRGRHSRLGLWAVTVTVTRERRAHSEVRLGPAAVCAASPVPPVIDQEGESRRAVPVPARHVPKLPGASTAGAKSSDTSLKRA